ncbi:Na+/H+ antiporter NhaA [Aliiroseovarius sp. S1123]|uniref:Na+/H+ antiporter NhaA n=1 Tax=unclassified Aliiroseovarius TaxID=2623558 RepID=UPI001FF1EF61|nr:Na+/H+ antiporter NhaA [Aliiroseovarius sp. S1123]MCK0172056.1 Na+/H+ antiporter NhaA [Aliiroseovarius sp. S1123]
MKKVLGLDPTLAAGITLAIAAMAGLVFENTPALRPYYDSMLTTKATWAIGELAVSKPLILWINDGLMAVFFLLVALEIKREIKEGSLSSWQQASLPVYGAIGGITVPALIFLGVVGIDSIEAKGWAIPAATDIAFALGVLSLFGDRVPAHLKTFLLTLAVVDDLAAIVIIALFYTTNLSLFALSIAALCLSALAIMNLRGVFNLTAYLLVGFVLWLAVLKSGVHATLAGVALGFAIPLAPNAKGKSLAKGLEHDLHPIVSFAILPLFAFGNAGVPLAGLTLDTLMAPLTLAVALGLFFGNQIGIVGMVFLAERTGLSKRADGVTWPMVYGLACLAGIGFTMSLFIGGLAFDSLEQQNMVRLGVLCGSLMSALYGAFVLFSATTSSATRQAS